MSGQKGHLAGIDILRFLAAALVMLFHLGFWSWRPETSTPKLISGGAYAFPELGLFASASWVGVEIFFVISGFVIVYSATGSAGQFLRSRVLRLVPGAWLAAPLSAMLLVLVTDLSNAEIGTRLLRSMVFWPFGPWVDGVYWTLGIEIAFYGLIWLLLAVGGRRHLVSVLCLLGLASTLFWLAANIEPAASFVRWRADVRATELTLLPHGVFFAIGGLLWALLCDRGSRWLWVVVAVSTVGGLLEIAHVAEPRSALVGSALSTVLAQVMWFLGVVAVGVSVVYQAKIGPALGSVWVRRLGLATYPLYLLHDVLGASVLFWASAAGVSRWNALAAAIILSIVASVVIAAALEPVLRRWIANLIPAPAKA